MSETRVIQQLRRKLALLVDNGYFTSLDEIAKIIGTQQKTLESWADYGSNKITKGLISRNHYPSIIDIFTKAISKHHSNIDFETIIKGEVSQLARYLSDTPRFTFHELVERESISENTKVYIDQKIDLSAVKRRSTKIPITQFSVTTKQWFWIEFLTSISSQSTIALQQRGNDWAFSDVEFVKEDNKLLLPGLTADGFPDSIQETHWDGINTFYVLQISKPWPSAILDMIQSGLPIDTNILQAIADHFSSCIPSNRCIFKVEIDIQIV